MEYEIKKKETDEHINVLPNLKEEQDEMYEGQRVLMKRRKDQS